MIEVASATGTATATGTTMAVGASVASAVGTATASGTAVAVSASTDWWKWGLDKAVELGWEVAQNASDVVQVLKNLTPGGDGGR